MDSYKYFTCLRTLAENIMLSHGKHVSMDLRDT